MKNVKVFFLLVGCRALTKADNVTMDKRWTANAESVPGPDLD